MDCILFANWNIAKDIQVWYDCKSLGISILFDRCFNEITLCGTKMSALTVMMATPSTIISDHI